MDYDPLDYDVPWRENYEAKAVKGWVTSIGVAGGVGLLSSMPVAPFLWMAGISAGMALTKLRKAMLLDKMQKSLLGFNLEFTTLDELYDKMKSRPEELWLGRGFEWENRHTQRVFEIQKRDASEIINAVKKHNKIKDEKLPIGHPWIHGVEMAEKEIYQPLPHGEGHTIVFGTTGSGKTRLFDLLVTQAVFRNETVIIIDPKGDKELRDNARRACEKMGDPDRFCMMHPSYPEESIRIDPLYNFTRPSEIASRIASIISVEGGFSDPFVAFGWQSLNNLVNLILLVDERPTLRRLKKHLKTGFEELLQEAIQMHADKNNIKDWRTRYKGFMARAKPTKRSVTAHAVLFYNKEVAPKHPNESIESVVAMYEHDITHFGKMIASLLPIMDMMTAPPYDELLSPNSREDTVRDIPASEFELGSHAGGKYRRKQRIFTFKQIIKQKKVVYIGADSLTDPILASAVSSILVADMTAVAGDIYNFAGDDTNIVNLFVDEAEAVFNDPLISLFNKGRGAKFRLVVATQTLSDIVVRLGSKDKAMQVLGNMNNIIALRIVDNETQQYMTENLPMTRIKYVMRTQGQNTDSNDPIMHGGNQGERLMEEEVELFPGPLMGMMPNLEYVAKISGGYLMKGRLPILIQPPPVPKKDKEGNIVKDREGNAVLVQPEIVPIDLQGKKTA